MKDDDGSYDAVFDRESVTVFDREAVTDIGRWSSTASTTGRPTHAWNRGSDSGYVRGRNALAPLRGAAVLGIRFSGGIAALNLRLISVKPAGSAAAEPRLIPVNFSGSAAADHRNDWGSPP